MFGVGFQLVGGYTNPPLAAVCFGLAALLVLVAAVYTELVRKRVMLNPVVSYIIIIAFGCLIGGFTAWGALRLAQKQPDPALSNAELSRQAIALAVEMRDFETEHRNRDWEISEYERDRVRSAREKEKDLFWRQYANNSIRRSNEHQNRFRQRYLGKAVHLRDEMLRRVQPPPNFDSHRLIAFDGMLAGPSPVSDAADYLEQLARSLPNE